MARWFPLVASLSSYDRSKFRGDVVAGLTTAVMLVPQAMGYALLAGLPPIYGLYSSLAPLVVYALLGSSRELAVGPVAMVSLLVASGVGAVVSPSAPEFVLYATLLALMVGIIQTVMGIGRLGFLVRLLSPPVISGFTSAAALIIAFSQLTHVLGFQIPRSHHVHEVAYYALSGIAETHPLTFAIGVLSILSLLLLKHYAPRTPRALIVVAVATVAVAYGELYREGVAIVGTVPRGLPAPRLPLLDLSVATELLPIAITISLVSFVESIAVAKKFASREPPYAIDANQELTGLGLANVAGAFSQGYPVTGGFSRTAVNAQAGARTSAAGLVTAAAVAVSLVFFTPLFFYLPKAVLAAIIMTAVMNLFEVREVVRLWRLARRDAVLLLITLGATLSLGIEQGIVLGLLASLGLMIYGRSKGDPSMKRFDIEPGITSAGQPSPEQLQGLAQEGFKTVIDLRAAGEAGHPADEAEIVERLGLGYRHLPITGPGDVNRETAETLAKLLDQGEGPVLVHCGSANRVGALLALKAKFVDGLSSAEALDYGKRAGLTDLSAHVEQTLG